MPADPLKLSFFFRLVFPSPTFSSLPLTQDVNECAFYDIIQQSVDKPLELDVFNSKTQQTRRATVVPSNKWSAEHGQGLLGKATAQRLTLHVFMALSEMADSDCNRSITAWRDCADCVPRAPPSQMTK